MTENPWSRLSEPSTKATITIQRVDANLPWNFFWAVDASGSRLLILRCESESISKALLPRLKGVGVETAPDPTTGGSVLMFRLLDPKQLDLFYCLGADIVACTSQAKSESEAIGLALGRTWRWHHLLRGGGTGKLSDEEQQGLIGELLVLEDILTGMMPVAEAVDAWTGPYGTPKDFEIGRVCIEVKARRGASSPFVVISSEYQLDSEGIDALFLHVVELTHAISGAANSLTLTELAKRVRDVVVPADPGSVEPLETALTAAGFRWEDDYSDSRWIQGTSKLFHVQDQFPRITSGQVHAGISRVKYSISLVECERFLVDEQVLFDEVQRGMNGA